MEHSFESRVAVRVRYNGHIHHCLALRHTRETHTELSIFIEELPKGYHDEHGVHQLTYKFASHCLIPDPSGKHGWICTEVMDVDETAGWERDTDTD